MEPRKRDIQKPGQPPCCSAAPICAPHPTTLPVLASSLAASGQQKVMWSPSIAAGSGIFPGGSGLDERSDVGKQPSVLCHIMELTP